MKKDKISKIEKDMEFENKRYKEEMDKAALPLWGLIFYNCFTFMFFLDTILKCLA